MIKTLVIRDDNLAYAAEVITSGGLVAVPTETVYGLAANGLNSAAVTKIYEIKGRPDIKPLSLLVSDIAAADSFCVVTDSAKALAQAFWPGPLTIVLRKRGIVPDIVTAGGDTVGVRCPDHVKTLELLRLAGVPLAAPSANPSEMPSPKSAEEVLRYFDGKIDCVIDGDFCTVGVESTIVDLTVQPFRILRHGALPEEDIRLVLETE